MVAGWSPAEVDRLSLWQLTATALAWNEAHKKPEQELLPDEVFEDMLAKRPHWRV